MLSQVEHEKSFITSGPGLKQRTSFMLSFLKFGGHNVNYLSRGRGHVKILFNFSSLLGNVHAFVVVC